MEDMELANETAKLVRILSDSLLGLKDFALDQLPEVFQQMIYCQYMDTGFCLFLLGLSALVFTISRKRVLTWDSATLPNVMTVISGIVSGFVLIPLMFSLYGSLTAFVAPKVYLLERVAFLVHRLS